MRLGDVEKSRAVLIGASSYADLPGLPAVRQNLIDLQRLLTDPTVWGLPQPNCVALADEDSVEVILDAVHEAAEAATDTLLVYYAGHGLLDQAINLRLATPSSDSRRMYKSLPYDEIRQELRDAVHCSSKVVILDCCYSGRAARGGMGRTADIADQAAVEGSWLVTASAEYAPALSPPDEPHTAFTGELVRLLDLGIANGPDLLDVDTLYLTLHQRLKAKGRPEPQQRIGNQGAQIVLAKNRRRGSENSRPAARRRLSIGPPDRLRDLPTSLDELTRMIDAMRARGAAEQVDSLLQVLGRHRDVQEVAATLAQLGYHGRPRDTAAVLDGLAVRGTRDCVAVLDVLLQLGARAAVESVLGREADAPAERVAELAELLASSTLRSVYLDLVCAAAVGRSDRVIDIVSNLLIRKLPEDADRLVDQCRERAGAAEIAAIADSLRDAGRDTAAFRLYPSALDELATRLPDQIAMLALGLHRHGDAQSLVGLVAKATAHRLTAAGRADLLVAFSAVKELESEVIRITDSYAGELDEKELEELADALRERGGNAVELYLAMLGRQPIEAVVQRVNDLVHHGRPLDVFAILEDAGATRSIEDLDKLTAGLHDTPEFSHQQRIYAAVVSRTETTVQLYRRLHKRKDGRLRILRAELIRQPLPILFEVVVHLVRSDSATLGEELLRYAAGHSAYDVAEELIRYASEETAEMLVIAAVGLPDLMRIVHALRQKGLHLEYRTHEAGKLLVHQSDNSIVVVVSALYTAEPGATAESTAARLAALPLRWVAYLVRILVRHGGAVSSAEELAEADLSGPETAMSTARAVLRMAARYRPDRASEFVAELHRRGLQRVILRYLQLWRDEHRTGVDTFIFAGALCHQFGPYLGSRILQGRAYLPQKYWADAVATAVSEVLQQAWPVCRTVHRFPVPAALVQRLISSGVLPDTDYCLLVIEFKAVLGRPVVFTDHSVRYGVGNEILYADLGRADSVQHHQRKVWLTRGSLIHNAPTWTMRTEQDAESLARLLIRVRQRVIEVRNRYERFKAEGPPELEAPSWRRLPPAP